MTERIGTRMASRDVMIDPVNSKVETTGFKAPPVDAEDFARSATVVPCTNPAIPPPAIRASVHFKNGEMSVITDAVTIVPAMTAAGVAIMSRT